jgi:hypothetical protein
MEMASALFHESNAFVPYGPGQYTPSQEGHGVHGKQAQEPQQMQHQEPQHEQERGREM